MSNGNDIVIKNETIRKEWDEKRKIWYFSVVDIVAIVTSSSDPRNYWKVLKSRLNKANTELVTKCNQLKMRSSDGKSYLTDTADSETMIDIIKIISTKYVEPFKKWFEFIESSNSDESAEELDSGAELTVDAYETNTDIIIESHVAGVSPENLFISISCNSITIKGKRSNTENISSRDSILQEIYWGVFSRTITLPSEVDIDESQANLTHGLLKIILPKINKFRTRTIKIKSLNN